MKRDYIRNTMSQRNARGALGALPHPSVLCKAWESYNIPNMMVRSVIKLRFRGLKKTKKKVLKLFTRIINDFSLYRIFCAKTSSTRIFALLNIYTPQKIKKYIYIFISVKTQNKCVIVLQCLCVPEFVSLLGCSPWLGMFPWSDACSHANTNFFVESRDFLY